MESPEERVGILSGVAEMKIAEVPVGAAVAGGLIAGIADGVLSLIPVKVPEIIARGFAAWAVIRWGPRFFGKYPAEVAGLFLAYDAMQSLFDFRGMIRGMFKKVTVAGLGAGLGEEEEIELPPELLEGVEGPKIPVGQLVPEGAKRGRY